MEQSGETLGCRRDTDGDGNCGQPGCPDCGNPAGAKVIGRVTLEMSYVVDLGDTDMVEHAIECCVEDIHNAVKYDDLDGLIKIRPDATLVEADIPKFLTEDHDDPHTEEAA